MPKRERLDVFRFWGIRQCDCPDVSHVATGQPKMFEIRDDIRLRDRDYTIVTDIIVTKIKSLEAGEVSCASDRSCPVIAKFIL